MHCLDDPDELVATMKKMKKRKAGGRTGILILCGDPES